MSSVVTIIFASCSGCSIDQGAPLAGFSSPEPPPSVGIRLRRAVPSSSKRSRITILGGQGCERIRTLFVWKDVRTVLRDGEPWFVAADVAEVLGYVDTDQAVRNHCKAAKILKPVESTGMKIPNRGMTVIPERDVYRLIMRSRKPEARRSKGCWQYLHP